MNKHEMSPETDECFLVYRNSGLLLPNVILAIFLKFAFMLKELWGSGKKKQSK